MTATNQRRHARLTHRAKIRTRILGSSNEYILTMRDFSESGLFLLAPEEAMFPINAVVEVQTTEFEGAAVQTGRVVRLEQGVGFAVEFLSASSGTDV